MYIYIYIIYIYIYICIYIYIYHQTSSSGIYGKICPNMKFPPIQVHTFPFTTKHLGKIRLHMIFTLFNNSLNKLKYNCFKKTSNLFHTHYFHKY